MFLALVGWHLRQDPKHEAHPLPPPEPKEKAPRIAIMTFVTEQRSYLYLSLKNKAHYARRHGYDFIMEYESHTNRAVVFWKFEMAQRLIKTGKYDWIWWVDFDTLFTNTDIKLTDIIDDELRNITNPDEIDYLVTHDCNGFNAGSFLVRGHERSLKFIQDSLAIHDKAKEEDIPMSEQDSTVKLMKEDKEAASRVHVVPQWKLNAFPQEIACFDKVSQAWEPGMFVLHFAGAWAHVKVDDPTGYLMNKYENEIIWGNWKDMY